MRSPSSLKLHIYIYIYIYSWKNCSLSHHKIMGGFRYGLSIISIHIYIYIYMYDYTKILRWQYLIFASGWNERCRLSTRSPLEFKSFMYNLYMYVDGISLQNGPQHSTSAGCKFLLSCIWKISIMLYLFLELSTDWTLHLDNFSFSVVFVFQSHKCIRFY